MAKQKWRKHSDRAAPPPTSAELAAWRGRIESLIAGGKSRDAVEMAKQLLKQAPGPDSEAMLVHAYQARIQALQASGMHKEAQALGALASERFPAHQAQFAPLLRQSEVSTGNFDTLLRELASAEPQRRRELEAVLSRGLTDPAMLANSPALPPDHPLKRMACTVSELFTAVTSGPLPEGALAPLNDIPRSSPLAPWKLLIRAFDAFYRHVDAAVLAKLAGIPADSGPGRLVPILRRLMAGNSSPDQTSFVVAALLDKVSGQRALVQAQVTRLSQALAAGNERQALAAVQALLPVFRTAPLVLQRTLRATLLQHWHRQDLRPEGLLRLLGQGRKDADLLRQVALTQEHAAWDEALGFWYSYLTAATEAGILPRKGPEVARVLLHMAGLFPPEPEEVFESLGVDSEQELRALIRSSDLPTYFDRAALLEQARAADAAPLVFRALIAHYDQWGDPKRAEAAAAAWRQTHPQALDPLLYLIRAAERHGAIRKALTLLTDAEALDRIHPEVRQSRFRLLLTGAERQLKEGKATLALRDLEQLAQEPRASEGDHKAYLSALYWAAAHQRGDAAAIEQAEQTLATTVANPVFRNVLLGAVAGLLKLSFAHQPAAASPAQAIEGLARASDLFRALGRPLQVPETLVKQVGKELGRASLAQLLSLCAGGLWIGHPALTYQAAGQGLAQSGPLVHRFLLARGQALCAGWGPQEQQRARQCLRAARELASRARDMEVVREASAALDKLPDWDMFDALLSGSHASPDETALTPEDITQVIDLERGIRKVPRFMAPTTPRQPRRARPRRRRGRNPFDELLSFLDFAGKF